MARHSGQSCSTAQVSIRGKSISSATTSEGSKPELQHIPGSSTEVRVHLHLLYINPRYNALSHLVVTRA